MSKFVPRWSRWNTVEAPSSPNRDSETGNLQACKTCKSPFAGFAGSEGGHSVEFTGALDHSEMAATPSPGKVAAMRLSAFADAGLVIHVHSEALDREVLFVSDNVPESKLEGRPEVVYRAHELKKLARIPPDPAGLRTVQMVKEIFGATIQGIRQKDRAEVSHAAEG